ncbi:uncharacterized protein LOC106635712 isoform X2 [Copidosoma floridanum]|uniref:uncharacterized protein LOC106635712 isoform X2 n=1 Tax=Copidosoma floridanum TaxID=29053 RepID=UPI000C6F8D0C|nr:uncharacterized protein LOC106635712 isoform X2 [Copidosoma floridanum]XP_023244875.1 uncharacterized protein LOC106635712 isoform X2 [Copidosoma floridanum]
MGQCVSRKAGAVIAASSHSPTYRIMDKKSKKQGDSKGSSKRGTPHTRGTAISFGFRRRGTANTGIPVPIANQYQSDQQHQRSKSVGPEHESRRRQQLVDDDYCCHSNVRHQQYYTSSGRSTPRLAPPKKESSGLPVRTNRFGFRSQTRYTDKVTDLGFASYATSNHLDKLDQYHHHHQDCCHHHCPCAHEQDAGLRLPRQSRSSAQQPKPRPSPVNHPTTTTYGNNNIYNHNNNNNNNNPNNNNNNNSCSYQVGNLDANRRVEQVSKYTLHTSHLPQPQYAVRVADASSKIAKTVANQSRKVGVPGGSGSSRGCSSKEGSGTEDSGLGSQHGCCSDDCRSRYDYNYGPHHQQQQQQQQQQMVKPRKLNVVVSGKSFDVRDVDEDRHVVTEISVIQLPSNFAQQQLQRATPAPCHPGGLGLVRERTAQYQRAILGKQDNRYITDSTTSVSTASMSTTSSEGCYDEGLGEEKAYKDRSRTEKRLSAVTTTTTADPSALATSFCSVSSGVATPSAISSSSASSSSSMLLMRSAGELDEGHEFAGHGGEAMADEYSSCEQLGRGGSDGLRLLLPQQPCNTVTQTTSQHFRAISNAARSGILPKSTLRSVLLTIEDPAFAAVAATTTTLIDDETSPVDSLFDSPTASVSQQSDVVGGKRGEAATAAPVNAMERSGNTIDDDSPGTPTNASLSLSEGREYFDDEIADQPGLVFDETLREVSSSGAATNPHNSQTLPEMSSPKVQRESCYILFLAAPFLDDCHNYIQRGRLFAGAVQGRSVENSPMHGRRIHRAGSVSTLSSCESLASDDLMMDYERSDASSFGDVTLAKDNSAFVMQDLDEVTSLLDLEIQGQEAMREWSSLVGQTQQALSNSANNNANNNQNTDSGALVKPAQVVDEDEQGGDYYQLTFPN